jgi:hypothetical protein
MMRVVVRVAIAAVLLAGPAQAVPGERDKLNACKAMVDRAAQAQSTGAAPDNAELQKCRQIIKEWTLRDSRMSVDEQGRPLR